MGPIQRHDQRQIAPLEAADTEGIRWLAEASADGAEIAGATPYIALLIDRASQRDQPLSREER